VESNQQIMREFYPVPISGPTQQFTRESIDTLIHQKETNDAEKDDQFVIDMYNFTDILTGIHVAEENGEPERYCQTTGWSCLKKTEQTHSRTLILTICRGLAQKYKNVVEISMEPGSKPLEKREKSPLDEYAENLSNLHDDGTRLINLNYESQTDKVFSNICKALKVVTEISKREPRHTKIVVVFLWGYPYRPELDKRFLDTFDVWKKLSIQVLSAVGNE
jgi:hypothetical protein